MAINIRGKFRVGSGSSPIPPALGYGYAFSGSGVTGGEGATQLVATTASNYISAIQTVGARSVKVTSNITYNGGSGSGTLKTLQGSKTIWSPDGRKIQGIGHWLTGTSGGNLIFRNMKMWGSGYDTDILRAGGGVENILFDHCDFTGDSTEYWTEGRTEGSVGDYDGALDGGDDWTYVTFANCKFDTYDKLMLLQNINGPRRTQITFYNCYFYNIVQRCPSVFNTDLHIFNCVFERSRGGGQIILHNDSKLLLEQCYIDNYTKTIHLWADFTGKIDPRSETDNMLVNSSVLYDPSMAGVKSYATFEPAYRAALVSGGILKPMTTTLANQIKAAAGATLSL